ncbi:MAG TPA: DNA repair protein RecO [bacterium]|nr:DNA repair protein RecO [bacterium]HOL96252.1 DNA repair protein RecO [bacterium]
MPILHTEAITLRRRRGREADALVTLFTRRAGKIIASTRGVLKTTSRYAGVTQPFNHLNVILYAKVQEQEIWTLTQVSLVESFDAVQGDLKRIAWASCLAEWIEAFSGDFESNLAVWDLLLDTLRGWNRREPAEEELIQCQWRLLVSAGLQPNLHHCHRCGGRESSAWYYLPADGCLACAACVHQGLRLGHGAIQALRRMTGPAPAPLIRLTPQQKNEIRRLLLTHVEYHTGVRLRSPLFLEQLDF